MIVRILLAGLLAGILAGAFATGVQAVKVWPLILEAESYEGTGEASHSDNGEQAEAGGHTHSHDGDAWAPHDGFERNFYSLVSNVITGIAYSLILTAAVLVSGQAIALKSGLVWGICGFIAFMLAPALGLPPEVPGMVGADVNERQVWWILTVLFSAGGLALFAFKQGWYWIVAGIALLLAPHIYGAPHAAQQVTNIPALLVADFVVATIVASALFWLFLGGALGILLGRVMSEEDV